MAEQRHRLVELIQAEVRATAGELGFDRLDPRVEQALRVVPRERFVPESERALAYINSPLPIGEGQTISQPYIVAIMSQLLDVGPGDRVYELGTGSGYQAAVLAAMGVEVYTVEIVPELAERAASTLESLGYDRVRVRAGDGWLGWPEAAPFDAIIVTAAAPHIPRRLVDQLAPDGRLVIPMGAPDRVQWLAVFTRDESGEPVRRDLLPVRFVPVTGAMEP
ncbi:MAG: protein-L-isoaspartate(D-aspartate) O-methyltransferase [Chromatiales bacterium]|nr:protein-L-isoaspartate(D-aspartate) O-methyltransferase [Chromatiales bacterium]